MKKYLIKLFIILAASGASSAVFATDLMDVYRCALSNDPQYQAAYSTMLSNQENLPQAVSALLPNIAGTANLTSNYLNVLSVNVPAPQVVSGAAGSNPLGITTYNSNGYSITLTQPIINFSNWMSVRQNLNVAKQATATYAAAAQDLMIRTAKAYFNVLLQYDNLAFADAQKASNSRQLEQAQERYNVGLDAITSVYNAKAAFDSSTANVIAAQNNVANSLEQLRQLTGHYYPSVEKLKIEIPLITPYPSDSDKWVCYSEQYNQTLMAARFNTLAKRAAIKVYFGGHLPTVNGVASFQRQNGYGLGTIDQETGSIGVQLNVPIYQGGYVNSQVRQAQDDYATSCADMEKTHRQVGLDTRQNFNDVMAGISKIGADRATIKSSQSSLASTEESYKVGTRTIIDVLIAQQQLYQSLTNYAQDVYNYLNDTLLLKQAAGTLCARDLAQINAWLHGPDLRPKDLYPTSEVYDVSDDSDVDAKVKQNTPEHPTT